uniref:Ig-like domain-containing protein n=1 Tax=Sphenodon punctatus TaxID=8508 RepID=A0A8D0H899_SPHPU
MGSLGLPESCWAGASVLMLLSVLRTHLTHCTVPPEHFLLQRKGECHYTNGTQWVRYLDRLIWDQQEISLYDSDIGFYVARTELGQPFTELQNRLEWLSYLWASVEKFCNYNYKRFQNVAVLNRKAKPTVKVSAMESESLGHPHQLVCFVMGFYPPKIEIKWFKNGQEELDGIVSSELLSNGDWTFQMQVVLPTTLQWGDVYTCQVEHPSLQSPMSVQWENKSAKRKFCAGIGGFVLGLTFVVVGFAIYVKKKKELRSLGTPGNRDACTPDGSSTDLLLWN